MRKLLAVLGGIVVLASVSGVPASATPSGDEPSEKLLCSEGSPICAEAVDALGYEGEYTGHDEPSLLFYSGTPGSGNNQRYRLVVPADPPTMPTQDGTGGTFNFQDRIAFWFGMDLCDNQSGPEFTHAPCTPNSDTNIFDGADPTKANYIGHHPGTAFLELQFYPPGWVPFQDAISCDATQWCAAMATFSLSQDLNTGQSNNAACLNSVSVEPANFAFITKSGVPHAPPSPLGATLGTFTPNRATDLFMNSGDVLSVDIHDGAAGLVTTIHDETTGQSGSMTASAANGFAQVIFEPTSGACHQAPYTFRPMYSTSSEHTRVPWAAHSYNVAFSDEIGHFEYCNAVSAAGDCTSNSEDALDDDDTGCFPASESLLVPISGCIATDNDFDGASYQPVWPGSGNGPDSSRSTPITFTSPLFNGSQNYSRVAFEADLPRIEAADFGGNCNRFTGTNCVNPPPGANFYPIYSTGKRQDFATPKPGKGSKTICVWQLGGNKIKDTTNTFGGNSAAEYGPLLFSFYPNPNPAVRLRTNNFRNVLGSNPCPA